MSTEGPLHSVMDDEDTPPLDSPKDPLSESEVPPLHMSLWSEEEGDEEGSEEEEEEEEEEEQEEASGLPEVMSAGSDSARNLTEQGAETPLSAKSSREAELEERLRDSEATPIPEQ